MAAERYNPGEYTAAHQSQVFEADTRYDAKQVAAHRAEVAAKNARVAGVIFDIGALGQSQR